MKTIPLDVVFDNEKFNGLFPACQLYLIKALYLLAKQRKLDPLPDNLRSYFHCSNPHYWRFKSLFREILQEIIPAIYKAKNVYKQRTVAGNIGQSKRFAERRLQRSKKETFSDDTATHTKFTPISSPANPYHKGAFDHVSVKNAKSNNDQAQEKTFTDD